MKRLPLLLFGAICALAQQREGATISGRVTDTAGKPIVGATLQLSANFQTRSGPRPQPYTAVTSSDGAYSFPGFDDPGNYTLKAIRAGYVPAETPDSFRLNPGDHLANINLVLTPASSISGKVTDENGDPIYGVVLQLWRRMRSPDGNTRLIPEQPNATTDNSGQYKILNVEPGTLYISANGRNSGTAETQLFDIAGLRVYQPNNPIFSAPPRPGRRPQAYLTTWFHAPVQLASGSVTSGIDIQLHKTSLYRISGKVIDAPGPAHLRVVTSAGQDMNTGQPENIAPNGAFEQNGLAPGDYYLAVSGATMDTLGLFGIQKFTIADQDIDSLDVPLSSPAVIHGVLNIDGKPPTQPLTVSIAGVDGPQNLYGFQQSKVESDGSFIIPRAIPGPSHVNAAPQGTYLTSVLLNGTEVGDTPFTLPIGPSTLQISFTAGTGQVRANVRPNAQGFTAKFVVIVPEPNTPGVTWRYRQLGTPGNGVFFVSQLPPGTYRLYAMEQADQDTFDPDTLKQYESQSVKVSVTGSEPVLTTPTTISQ